MKESIAVKGEPVPNPMLGCGTILFLIGVFALIVISIFRVMKMPLGTHCCEGCYFDKCRFWINKACNNFCYFLPENCKFVLNEKSIKHKG